MSAPLCRLEGGQAVKFFCYGLILLTSLCGNSLITTIIYRSRRMRTTTNYFIANMAISDLLLPIFVVPNKIVETFTGEDQLWLIHGDFGNAMCKLIFFLHDASLAVSLQSLVVIAVDRFFAVVYPFRPPILSKRSCPLVIALTWIVATLTHFPYFYALRLDYIKKDAFCLFQWELAFTKESLEEYIMFLLIALTALPLLVIIILYSVIAYDLVKRSIGEGNRNDNTRKRRESENRKVTKMLVVIVLAFIISFAPNFVLVILSLYAPNAMKSMSPCANTIITAIRHVFFYLNGAINPIIYFIFSENYRHGLRAALKTLCACCPDVTSRSRRLETDGEEISTRIQASVELTRYSIDVNALSFNFLSTSHHCGNRNLMANGCYKKPDSHYPESVL